MISKSTIIGRLQYLLKIPHTKTSLHSQAVISRARENLADTVVPYRWADDQLAEFVNDGTAELRNMRSDVDNLSYIPDAFASALANYTTYRALALDNDAQNNNGSLSDKYYNLFLSQAAAVPFFFTDEQLGTFADESVTDLIAHRPELRISANNTIKENIITSDDQYDLPERFSDAVVYAAAGRAAMHSKNDSAGYFFEQYNGALKTI